MLILPHNEQQCHIDLSAKATAVHPLTAFEAE